MDKSTKIKSRLLEVAKNKGISYETFFEGFGTTYANFKGKSLKSSLRSSVLVDFSSKHPDVDLHWLITGEKKYENSSKVNTTNDEASNYGKSENIGKALETHINNLVNKKVKSEVAAFEEKIEILSKMIVNMELEMNIKEKEKKH